MYDLLFDIFVYFSRCKGFFFFFFLNLTKCKEDDVGKEQDGHQPDYIRLLRAARCLLLYFRLTATSLASTTCKKLWEANVDKVSGMSRSSVW